MEGMQLMAVGYTLASMAGFTTGLALAEPSYYLGAHAAMFIAMVVVVAWNLRSDAVGTCVEEAPHRAAHGFCLRCGRVLPSSTSGDGRTRPTQ